MTQSNEQLYEQLVERHATDVYHYFHHWGYSRAEVHDLSQEAFLEAWKSLSSYRGDSSLKVWMLTICKRIAWRRARDHAKSKELLTETFFESIHPSVDGQRVLEQKALLRAIAQHLPRLKEAQREVLYLFYHQELSEREISELLGTPQGTIHSRLHNARKQLRLYCQLVTEPRS